jgi:hypothetical protein
MAHMRHRIIPGFAFLFALAALAAAAAPRQAPAPVWVGVQVVAEKDIPAVEGKTAGVGLRVVGLPCSSPAGRAGMAAGDVIVAMDGNGFPGDGDGLPAAFRDAISKRAAGDEIAFRVMRESLTIGADGAPAPPASAIEEIWRDPKGYLFRQPAGALLRLNGIHERRFLDVKVRVEARPAGIGATKSYSAADAERRGFPKSNRAEEQLAGALIAALGFDGDYRDLRERLARLTEQGDPFRLSRVSYVQSDPFQLRAVADDTFSRIADAAARRDSRDLLGLASDWLDASVDKRLPLETGLSLDRHLDRLVRTLQDAEALRREAFARMSDEEREFLSGNAESLFKSFAASIAIDEDADPSRWQRHARVLELAGRVDYRKLFEGAALLWSAADARHLEALEAALRKAWIEAGKPDGVFIDRPSPAGRILIGGTGSTWYREDAAILLDLGGNDFYTNNAGSPRAASMPAALLIDFAGNDSYEATFNWTQGAALLGHGLLIDRKGDDAYVAQDWAQGAAAFGTALFLDEAGNDVYRGNQYAQGVAAFGIGVHVDLGGDDIYEAHFLSQAVGLPGGAGWLVNADGNDRYYAKGSRPTNYGDAGIFDSWSQGCAVGFRGLLSGGVALLLDTAGRDRYEAGNFSQGGGYYFGIGMLRDGGRDNDVYIGSRYNQAFAAHQAVGLLDDEGGDDFYTTRHGVAQSIAWDESVAIFVDRSGDDVYEGGSSFSQGAGAHNGFAVFLDLGGRNRFVYGTPQGSAGPNGYHGGSSFSLFVAAGDRGNSFTSQMMRSNVRVNGERGIFVDMPESLERAVGEKSCRMLLP